MGGYFVTTRCGPGVQLESWDGQAVRGWWVLVGFGLLAVARWCVVVLGLVCVVVVERRG